MFRAARLVLGTISIVMLFFAPFMSAQNKPPTPPAPVPAQIVNAKKVFISNGGQQPPSYGDPYFSGGPDRAYNQFYAAMKDWGRFELVPAPADADLVLQVHMADLVHTGVVEFKLTVLDPKTNIALWTLSESTRKIGRAKTREANFDTALSHLSDDFKRVVTGAASPPAEQK